MRRLAVIALVALTVAGLLGGRTLAGRVLLAAGAHRAAALVLKDPGWRGVALYRSGDFAGAAAAFRIAGDHYNLGTSAAREGNYALALEALDLARAAGDPRAAANFDLVAAHYAALGIDVDSYVAFPVREEGATAEAFVGQGSGRAASTGDAVTNTNTMLGLAELDSRGRLGVRQVFDDTFIVADERWLRQLEDVPGAFMQARIRAEHKRRDKLGLTPPAPEDPR